MKRGDVYWVNFQSVAEGEIKKKRPAVIVSNNAANKHLNRIQVVPLTSNVKKLYPSEAYVTVRKRQAKAMADQIATVSKKRLLDRMSTVSKAELKGIERALKVQLGIA